MPEGRPGRATAAVCLQWYMYSFARDVGITSDVTNRTIILLAQLATSFRESMTDFEFHLVTHPTSDEARSVASFDFWVAILKRMEVGGTLS